MISVCAGWRDETGRLHPCGRWSPGDGEWYEPREFFAVGVGVRASGQEIVPGLCPEHEEKAKEQLVKDIQEERP